MRLWLHTGSQCVDFTISAIGSARNLHPTPHERRDIAEDRLMLHDACHDGDQLSGRTATAWQDESMKPYTFQRKVPHCDSHFASGISLPYYRQPLLSIYITMSKAPAVSGAAKAIYATPDYLPFGQGPLTCMWTWLPGSDLHLALMLRTIYSRHRREQELRLY